MVINRTLQEGLVSPLQAVSHISEAAAEGLSRAIKEARALWPKGSMYFYSNYLGLKGVTISLLWGLCIYYSGT